MKNKPLLFVIALLILVYAFVGCPIRLVTGVPCPGCGMTRAWLCVLRLDFAGAFAFHPLWPLPLLVVLCHFTVRRRSRRAYHICLGAAAALMFAVYGLRLWLHSPIVEPHPENGLIVRAFRFLQERF